MELLKRKNDKAQWNYRKIFDSAQHKPNNNSLERNKFCDDFLKNAADHEQMKKKKLQNPLTVRTTVDIWYICLGQVQCICDTDMNIQEMNKNI